MMRVISSPSISTTGVFTLIFAIGSSCLQTGCQPCRCCLEDSQCPATRRASFLHLSPFPHRTDGGRCQSACSALQPPHSSEELRVGNECVITCRSRVSRVH